MIIKETQSMVIQDNQATTIMRGNQAMIHKILHNIKTKHTNFHKLKEKSEKMFVDRRGFLGLFKVVFRDFYFL